MPKTTTRRQNKFPEFLGMPVAKGFKERIKRIADSHERSTTEMARMLLRDAVERAEENAKELSGKE